MKGFIVFALGILAVILVVGGAAAFTFVHDVVDSDGGGGFSVNSLMDKVSNVETSFGSSDGDSSVLSDVGDIVSEEIKTSGQQEGLTYREVTYEDGGFRQFDAKTGELIGSSYESDQDKLPNME